MKKVRFIRTFVFAASLLSITSAYSQPISAGRMASLDHNRHTSSPSVMGSTESADKTALTELKTLNTKLFNHFSSGFKNAKNIKVSADKGETHVSCYVDGVLNKIDYTSKGRWLYTIRYYEAVNLPSGISDLVNESYPRYSIYGFVAEVSIPGSRAYLVMIEDKNSWKRVRVVNESVDTYEEYKKQ